MNRKELKAEISNLLRGPQIFEEVFFYASEFYIVSEMKLCTISREKAEKYLLLGAELWQLSRSKKEFDHHTGQWRGEDQAHNLPEGLPECKIINFTIDKNQSPAAFMLMPSTLKILRDM